MRCLQMTTAAAAVATAAARAAAMRRNASATAAATAAGAARRSAASGRRSRRSDEANESRLFSSTVQSHDLVAFTTVKEHGREVRQLCVPRHAARAGMREGKGGCWQVMKAMVE